MNYRPYKKNYDIVTQRITCGDIYDLPRKSIEEFRVTNTKKHENWITTENEMKLFSFSDGNVL